MPNLTCGGSPEYNRVHSPLVVPRWAGIAARRAARFFALKGLSQVRLGHSAATPWDAIAHHSSSPQGRHSRPEFVPPFQGEEF